MFPRPRDTGARTFFARIRLARRITFTGLEQRCGLSRRQVSKLERGDCDSLQVGTLKRVAEYLGIPDKWDKLA
jgi:transcriptional regulator with XRE-family HTH domain